MIFGNPRIQCPQCGRVHRATDMNLPSGTGAKAIVVCGCGETFAVELRAERTWFGVTWRKAHVKPVAAGRL